jgi:two-component system CheB/CheR fusion protein
MAVPAKSGKKAASKRATVTAESIPQNPFFVVGVGASAGGIEAFKQLLHDVPADTGAAFVLVQHLDPTHESVLQTILSAATPMPVDEVRDGMPVEPNHVYVIPAAMDLAIGGGLLKLLPRPRARGAHHMPIDAFFRTLAAAQGAKAIGVILSGTASDGTQGLGAIKAAGGICFAQEPGSAKYDGMPRSAIAAGCVDFVLPPGEIAGAVARLAGGLPLLQSPAGDRGDGPLRPAGEEEALAKTFLLLRKVSGNDLGAYKRPTLLRRIRRRMALADIERIQEYASHLESHPAEVQSLYQDLLIGVTSFFRDLPAVEALVRDIFPKLIKDRPAEASLRIWVPGCSSGEEVYTLAICLLELLGGTAANPSVQIFGTDVSEAAVAKARAGIYPEKIAGDVSPERLARFFTRIDGRFQISKTVRALCIFARHDLIQDPPFSRLDLISCRNVLIYLRPEAQKRVMAGFHYALQPTGYLILGKSESPAAALDRFQAVDREHKIYAPEPSGSRSGYVAGPAALPREESRFGIRPGVVVQDAGARAVAQREADRVLLSRYSPAGVLIDESLEILQFRGDTQPYLEHAQGQASLSLLRMARKGLLAGLSQAVQEAKDSRKPVHKRGLKLRDGDGFRSVDVEVIPIQAPAMHQRSFIVLFEGSTPAGSRGKARVGEDGGDGGGGGGGDYAVLAQELAATREYLQCVIDDQTASNQELQAAHEEALSGNEELQSLNEELETAKEELQSGNEELTTLNEELRHRNDELIHLSDDLVNLLGSLHVPVILLGPDLRLRRFTPGAAKLFNLLPTDQNRLLTDLRSSFDLPDLGVLIHESITNVNAVEREVQDRSGCWYSLRIHPYKTSGNKIDGAVMVLVDIHDLKVSAGELAKARDFSDAVIQTVREPFLILSGDLRVEQANRAFYDLFQVTPKETEGLRLDSVGNGDWNVPALRALLESVLLESAEVDGFEVEKEFSRIGRRTMALSSRRVRQTRDEPAKILLAMDDRTELKRAEEERAGLLAREQALTREAERASRLKDEFVATVSHELRGPLSAMTGWMYVLDKNPGNVEIAERGLAAIHRNVLAQVKLVDDLLDIARIMTGKLSLAVHMISLQTVVEAAIQAVSAAADAKGIAVHLECAGAVTQVLGDADRMQQIAWNLLSNAVKFTPSGGRVDIRIAQTRTSVQLRVRDTGKGIDAEFQPHVFERFRQAEGSPVRDQLGLGLGLAIVRDLTELQGGTVTVESAGKDQGATFTVAFPIPPLLVEPAETGAGEALAAAGRPALQGLRLLVVEDEDSSREMLATLLAQLGAEVTATASAAEAFAALAEEVPDVLISDIGMPGESGYDLLRKVRSLPPAHGGLVPAIAFTAYSSEQDRLEALAAGFQMHHTKPADPARLVAAIAMLGRRPAVV